MSRPTAPITVKNVQADGTPIAGATVVALLSTIETYGSLVIPGHLTALTDQNGQCVLNLFPNGMGSQNSHYTVRIDRGNGEAPRSVRIVIPTTAAADIEDLLYSDDSPPQPIVGPVTGFNGRHGAVVLTQPDIATAGGVVGCAAITALAAANLANHALIIARGRDGSDDGGEFIGWYDANSMATPDGGIVHLPSDRTIGQAGRYIRNGYTVFGYNGPARLSWFGLPMDGASDALGALQRAKASPYLAKGTIDGPPGIFVLSGTFVNDAPGQKWRLAGAAAAGETSQPISDFINNSSTLFMPGAGFPAGAPLWWDRPASITGNKQRMGGGLQGVTFYGNGQANGLQVDSVEGANYSDILALSGRDWGYKIGVAYDGVGGGMGSCVRNTFSNCDGMFNTNGAVLWGNSAVGYNASLNIFIGCHMRGGSLGWLLENCDSNSLNSCGGSLQFCAGDGMTYSVGTDRSARANQLTFFQGGVVAKAAVNGTSPHSYRNALIIHSKENGATLVIEAGAKIEVMNDQTSTGGDVAGRMFGFEKTGTLMRKGGQTIVANTPATMAWNVEVYDTSGIHNNPAKDDSLYTPNGVNAVRLSAQIEFTTPAGAGTITAAFLKNGVEFPGQPQVVVNENSPKILSLASGWLDSDAGDEWQLQLTSTFTGGVTITSSNRTWCALEIK